jgi:hypothetical protein
MNREQIEALLRDYRWMRKEVDRLERILFGYSSPMRSWGVSQYGIEATLPKGSPGKSQAELKDMDIREERLYKRLKKYQKIVYAIELAVDFIEDEKMKIVYDCILEGMSYRAIGYHLGISREQVRRMKNKIIDHLCQSCHFLQLLKEEKSAV